MISMDGPCSNVDYFMSFIKIYKNWREIGVACYIQSFIIDSL